jgi:hypothetical protein
MKLDIKLFDSLTEHIIIVEFARWLLFVNFVSIRPILAF